MASEIEVVDEIESRDRDSPVLVATTGGGGGTGANDDNLRNNVYTADAYGDLEKLQRLVGSEIVCKSLTPPPASLISASRRQILMTHVAPSKYLISPPQPPPPTAPAPAAAVHTKTISATLNGNEGKRSPAAIAHTKTISAIVNGNEGKRSAATGQGGEIGAAEQRAAEWGLVLKTGDETGKPQGVKVRTSGDYIVWSLAKPSPHHGDAAYDSPSIN